MAALSSSPQAHSHNQLKATQKHSVICFLLTQLHQAEKRPHCVKLHNSLQGITFSKGRGVRVIRKPFFPPLFGDISLQVLSDTHSKI